MNKWHTHTHMRTHIHTYTHTHTDTLQVREQSIYCVHIAVEMAPIAKVCVCVFCTHILLLYLCVVYVWRVFCVPIRFLRMCVCVCFACVCLCVHVYVCVCMRMFVCACLCVLCMRMFVCACVCLCVPACCQSAVQIVVCLIVHVFMCVSVPVYISFRVCLCRCCVCCVFICVCGNSFQLLHCRWCCASEHVFLVMGR